MQYADFALWQREEPLDEQIDGWRQALAGLPEEIDLPADRPRPAEASHRGDVVEFDLPGPVAHDLRRLARTHGVSMFMVVQAAVAVLLTRWVRAPIFRWVRRWRGVRMRRWMIWSVSS